jgi:chitinase
MAALVGLAVLFVADSSRAVAADEPAFRVVGYLPDYRLAEFDPHAAKHLTDMVYFSAEPTAEGELVRGRLDREALQKLHLIKQQHGLKLLLTVGGWERSAGFVAMAAAAAARERFASECLDFCKEYDFDGIDIDWEHPANEAQQRDFGSLLATLKKALQTRKLRLTIAIAEWQPLPREAIAAVDQIHLMAYDAPGRHSTYEYAAEAVERVIQRGAPAEKICLGIPFYGRAIKQPNRTLTYAGIADKYQPQPATDELDGIYFNGPDTVRRKTRMAHDLRLGGVMIWELGQDAKGDASLLRAIGQVR